MKRDTHSYNANGIPLTIRLSVMLSNALFCKLQITILNNYMPDKMSSLWDCLHLELNLGSSPPKGGSVPILFVFWLGYKLKNCTHIIDPMKVCIFSWLLEQYYSWKYPNSYPETRSNPNVNPHMIILHFVLFISANRTCWRHRFFTTFGQWKPTKIKIANINEWAR